MANKKESRFFSEYEDDGRTVAEMNVPGMPWHDAYGAQTRTGGRFFGRRRSAESRSGEATEMPPLTRRETWGIIANAVLAGLAIAGIFLGALILFVLFSIHVWFA